MTPEKAIERLKAEYERAKSLSYVVNPLAYALYQVWKEADKKKTRDTLKSSESEDNATPTDSLKKLKVQSRTELAEQAPERNASGGRAKCKTIEE